VRREKLCNKKKKKGEILVCFLAFMKMSIAVNMKVKPVMPLTSLADMVCQIGSKLPAWHLQKGSQQTLG